MTKLQDTRFKKTNFTANDATEFDAGMLRILMAIDGNKSVHQIAKETKLAPAVFQESFFRLYKFKFIEEVKAPREASIDGSFIQTLQDALVSLVGPLGAMLLDEAAEMMDFEVSKVPKSRAADLIHQVSQGIPGEKQQEEFKKAMLQQIKGMA